MNKIINNFKSNIPEYMNNYLFKNTIILIFTSLLIKMLSLVNRVMITRLLGKDGISLYVLILPTIMLLCTISGFSLSTTMSKIVAENEKNKLQNNYFSYKSLLKIGIKYGLYASLITLIVFVLSLKTISVNLLKQESSFYPLLFSITMIPISMFNSVFKGFYNGLDKIEISSRSSLIEQISRMVFSFILLIIYQNNPISFLVSISIIAMTFGEIISLIYNFKKIKKYLIEDHHKQDTTHIEKKLFSLSLSQTLSHLITNISFFLEPIVYTYVLNKINILPDESMHRYSEVNAYAIPLLSMFMFTSASIATVIIPIISKNNYTDKARNITKIALRFALIPSIFLGIILFYFGDKYLFLLYKSTIGSEFVKKYAFIFSLFYLQPILTSVLQAHGKQKKLFIYTIIASFLKIILICSLSFIKIISYKSLFYSIIIANSIYTLSLFFYLKKILSLKIDYLVIMKFIFIFIISFYSVYLLKWLNIHYILISIISFFLYLILIKISNITSLHDK